MRRIEFKTAIGRIRSIPGDLVILDVPTAGMEGPLLRIASRALEGEVVHYDAVPVSPDEEASIAKANPGLVKRIGVDDLIECSEYMVS